METQFWKLETRPAAKRYARMRGFGAAFVSAGRAGSHEFRSFELILAQKSHNLHPPCARARRSGSIAHLKEFGSKYQHFLINKHSLLVLGDVGLFHFCVSRASL